MRRGLPNPGHRRAARWIALGTALLIAWGSLYPLAFILPTAAQIKARLALAGAVVFSRTDLIANFLLYLPFGAICRLSLGGAGRARRPLAATLTATLIGSALAFTLELAQLATPHRVTNLIDWAVNTAGCACGALAIALYLRLGRLRRLAGLRHPLPALVPSCLLAIWIIGEFAPYLPTHHAVPLGRMLAEFHERRAMLAAHASLALTRWWIIAECVRQIWRRPWALPCLAALIGLTALEQAYVGTDRRSVEEWLSWCVVPVLVLLSSGWSIRARAWVTITGCIAVLVTSNVWPLALTARLGVFHWIPFSGTLLATRDYRPLLDSLFFNGALLWSLTLALGRPSVAFLLTLASSVAVQFAHLMTPPHRAEITNPLLVVALLIVFAAARRYQTYAYGEEADAGGAPQTSTRRSLIRRRLLDPLLALLTQGADPERLALSVAVGIVVGNVPILGISTVLCTAIALLFGLNLVAIQLAQAAMAPTQLLLIIPFVRLGEWLTRAPPQPLSLHADLALIAGGAGRAIIVLWRAILHGGLAWLLIAPVAVFVLYKALTPLFERAAARLRR